MDHGKDIQVGVRGGSDSKSSDLTIIQNFRLGCLPLQKTSNISIGRFITLDHGKNIQV
nr:hypothetical protein Iba_chr12cCG5270 [Ipomoea batatas]